MNEKLLHFIWRLRLFRQTGLLTTEGEKAEIIYPGTYNTDAGADFTNAKIKIGNTLWVGNVEIHIRSADWFQHKHETDAAYNNVILHVVYEMGNKTALRNTGEKIPTIELKGFINPGTIYRYEELMNRKKGIPCEKFFNSVSDFIVRSFLERMLVERLQNKVEQINLLLQENENDWENVMFQMLAKYLGAGINKDPFQLLAKSLPVKVFTKHSDNSFQLEALIFGQAGFLDEKYDDVYPNSLRKEYNYLKRLHHLQPLKKPMWKFLRLRPSNFPTIRLAQLAALMKKEVKLFSAVLNAKNAKTIRSVFEVQVNDYWKTHYLFDKESKKVYSHIGNSQKNILLINAVAPVLFAYGKYKASEVYCERALQLIESCEPENNSIISSWKKLGFQPSNASETQALLQLRNEYCNNFRCLECSVGASILQK